jgi:hypothetical protein
MRQVANRLVDSTEPPPVPILKCHNRRVDWFLVMESPMARKVSRIGKSAAEIMTFALQKSHGR